MTSDDDYWANFSTRGGLDSEEKAREAVIRERGCSEEEWDERMRQRTENEEQAQAESRRIEDEYAKEHIEKTGCLWTPTGRVHSSENE